uniref:Putative secreted protein n=1 Tax=Ornithodoros turicata TaxID=34597 RepID=A0A2R5LCV4_9ACAR
MTRALVLCLPLLLALVAENEALSCAQHACDEVICEEISEQNCDGRYVRKGGICRCCDICIRQLEYGERCPLPMLPWPEDSECQEGLVCHYLRHVCVAEGEDV